MFINKKIKKIKVILTDCDGVLTDGGMYYSEKGDEMKKFNTRDGMAFKMLKDRGLFIGIITGEKRDLVKSRGEKLNFNVICLGVKNKMDMVKKICVENNYSLEQIAYFGDDINDLEVLKSVGLAICPKDAEKNVKKVADIITISKGGQGVIREFVNKYFS